MTKTRSVADTANDNSVPGSRIEDGTLEQSKLSPGVSTPPSPGSVSNDSVANDAAISSEKLSFVADGAGTVARSVQSKLRESISISDFGAIGDGIADDTAAFQAAISHIKSIGGGDLLIPSGTYNLTSELSLNQGFDVSVNLIGLGSNSNRPVLSFSGSVPICVKIRNSKSTFIENVVINTANVTGTHVALFINAMWDSMLKNVSIGGPGGVAPGATASFGLLVRATYNGYVSGTIPFLTTYVDPILSPSGFNMGTYWSSFERVSVGGYTYGLTLAGREGTSASINQNSFVSCKFNGNYYNIWCDGTGGGITFISTTAEGSGDDSVTINRVSSGSSPVWIGGELSGGGKWVGPGLILNAVSGTDYPNPNTSGDNATHLRFTNQGPQLFGNKLGGAAFISDWDSKVSVESGSGTTSSKTLDIIEVTGLSSTPKSFEITVSFADGGSPQGGAVLKYIFSAMDVAGAPPISTQLTKLHDHVSWSNLSGGTVDPILTATTVGSTVTITADVNWDNVGTDPGESDVAFTVVNEAGVGTVTLL